MATKLSIREKAEQGLLDDEYAEYLQKHSDRLICNGDSLLRLMEQGYLLDEFIAWKEKGGDAQKWKITLPRQSPDYLEVNFRDLVDGGYREVENRTNLVYKIASRNSKVLLLVFSPQDMRCDPSVATISDIKFSLVPLSMSHKAVIRCPDGKEYVLKDRDPPLDETFEEFVDRMESSRESDEEGDDG